jgi:uncharacterized membrane protein required for colicin V production
MTWLDLVCLLTLGIVAVGGYAQGFVRGMLRIFSLAGGGALGVLFMLRVESSDDLQQMVLWTIGAALLGIAITSLFSWSVSRAIPPFVHHSITNRVLGMLPALLIALVVLVFLLGLADRLAITTDQRIFLRSGILTGPLIVIVDWIEQHSITIR